MSFPGWSPRETGRRAGRNPDILREMARGKWLIDVALAGWLESVAGAWARVPAHLHARARSSGCADGTYQEQGNTSSEDVRFLVELSRFHQNLKPPELVKTQKITA